MPKLVRFISEQTMRRDGWDRQSIKLARVYRDIILEVSDDTEEYVSRSDNIVRVRPAPPEWQIMSRADIDDRWVNRELWGGWDTWSGSWFEFYDEAEAAAPSFDGYAFLRIIATGQ